MRQRVDCRRLREMPEIERQPCIDKNDVIERMSADVCSPQELPERRRPERKNYARPAGVRLALARSTRQLHGVGLARLKRQIFTCMSCTGLA